MLFIHKRERKLRTHLTTAAILFVCLQIAGAATFAWFHLLGSRADVDRGGGVATVPPVERFKLLAKTMTMKFITNVDVNIHPIQKIKVLPSKTADLPNEAP